MKTNPLKSWIGAMRLRTLPLAAASIITGNAVALSKGFSSMTIFSWSLVTTLLLQILSNLANDLGDGMKGTDNDDRVGPKRSIQAGAISVRDMKIGVAINALLALVSGVVLIFISLKQNPEMLYFFLSLGIIAILAALGYTLGKKAYGYQGLGDLFVFIFFGWVGVIGSQFLITESFTLTDLIPASILGLLSAAVLNMNNIRDHKNDKKHHKNTLVVKMGVKNAKLYHSILIFSALLLNSTFFFVADRNLLYTITFLPFVFLVINAITTLKNKDEKELDKELKKIALSTFIYSITLNTYYLL